MFHHTVKKKYIPAPHTFKVDTVEQCQLKCQERAECEYFQFHNGDFSCYLKIATADSAAKPNNCCTFGPKYCKGKNTFICEIRGI